MAHARRYFEKALDNDKSRASHALNQIQKLYALERTIKQKQANARLTERYRRAYAIPILKTMYTWMQEQYTLKCFPRVG